MLNLYGYPIPGSDDRLITRLFIDDTTVYLDRRDSYKGLLSILRLWCLASGARFNINKTEIIPIGTLQYRNKLLETQKISPGGTPLNQDIHIVKEQEPTQMLGGWISNIINNEAMWSKNLDKIQAVFERWDQ
jgi:hypothetical protein